MVYWKLDDETIRCLINKDEIGQMGFDLNEISHDSEIMSEFLNAIIDDSHKYIDWNAENGIQNFAARALPADQYLITISCTFKDQAINHDLNQIRRMFQALESKLTPERMKQIEEMAGEDKEKAFAALSKDLQDIFTGKTLKKEDASNDAKENTSETIEIEMVNQETKEAVESIEISPVPEKKAEGSDPLPAQRIIFHDMSALLEFISLLDKNYAFDSCLYRLEEEYNLVVDFKPEDDNVAVITFIITAEEFGADVKPLHYYEYYLREHGDLLIEEDAITVLRSFA